MNAPARWQLALAAALTAAALTAPFAYIGSRRSAQRIETEWVAWSDDQTAQAVAYRYSDDIAPPPNAWLVNPVDQWADPLSGDVWTSPPLFRLADDAMAYGVVRTDYEFDGQWLAQARWLGGNDVVVAVVQVDEREAEIAAARRGWLFGWVALAALAGGLGWWLAERLRQRVEAPVERAHLVNRDFIADAAHELRTPLSIIQASAGHALARDRSTAEYQESLSEILTAAERAGASVGELLEFARLEAGQGSLRLAPLRLDLLVEEVAVSIRADDTTVEVAPSQAVVVEADYNLIRQVVDNLTRNAVARADKVTLAASIDEVNRRARVDISDNGPGFDPGMLDHVFQRFRRGDRSGTAGLGLAIARTIVELHHGGCEAANLTSSHPGGELADGGGETTVEGARVSFWLPLS